MNNAWVCPFVLVLGACGACGETSTRHTNTAHPATARVTSGFPIERYFPITHDHLWTYDSTSDTGERNTFIVRGRRVQAAEGELQTPRGTKRFVYKPEAIGLVDSNTYILKHPLTVGTEWRGEHGGISRIETVGATITIAAGTFKDCIVTIEERGGDAPATYSTTFCPDVGIVLLDVEGGMQHERAELRTYGPPVFIGPPGTTLTPP